MKRRIPIILGLFVWALAIGNAFAVVPPLIPVQGVLTDAGGQVLDGSQDLTFTIYESLAASSSLWTETQTGVSVDEGFFSVYLGDETELPVDVLVDAQELWLSMTVGGEELSRVQLASVPYALEAQVCRQIGDLEEDDVQPILSGDNACEEGTYLRGWDGDAGAPICDADMVGDGGVVAYVHDHDDLYYTETEIDSVLAGKSDTGHNHDDLYYTETEMDSALAGKSDTSHDHDDLYYTETELQTSGSAAVHWDNLSSVPVDIANGDQEGVTGVGTMDRLARFTGSTAVGDSNIVQSGENIGIGTETPAATLEVAGDVVAETVAPSERFIAPSATRPASYCNGINNGELWFDPGDGNLHMCRAAFAQHVFNLGGHLETVFKHYVFTTHVAVSNGNMSGLAGADAICEARAAAGTFTAANAPGASWKALLSAGPPPNDARSRVYLEGVLYNTANQVVATGNGDLWDGTIANSIQYSENGSSVSAGPVWTGTNTTGTHDNISNCAEWTSGAGGVWGRSGLSGETDSDWVFSGMQTCSSTYRLYCVSDGIPVGESYETATEFRRRMFITSQAYGGDLGGLAGANSKCRTAAAAGRVSSRFAGPWYALLSTTGQDASGVILGAGTIYNMEGELVSDTIAGLWDNSIDNPISTDENGALVSDPVWTGSENDGAVYQTPCQDWTSNSSGYFTYTGSPSLTTNWFSSSSQACSTDARLFCISAL